DGSYMPLYNVPTQYTYGETVYDKGSTVVQSMRAYFGDSIFFDAATAYLEEFAYNSASSYDMRDFLTDHTGIDMTDFFEAWVFTAGTPHFSIDSFAINENGANFDVDIYSKQKYKGVDFLANSNIVEVNFIDEDWNIFSDTIHFSGKTGHSVKQLSFEPIAVFIDLYEKTCDATTDNYQIVDAIGEYDFPKTFCMLDFEEISDSAFVRVTHNWAAPDSLKNPIAALILSDYRYWKIEGAFPENFTTKARFFYSKISYLDNTLLANQEDSLVVLYRENASVDWQGIDFYRIGNSSIGNIYVENAQPGEYTLAVWDAQYVGENEISKNELKFEVFPNPSSESFTFVFDAKENSILKIYDSSSKLVKSFNTKKGENTIKWIPSELAYGTYFLQLVSGKEIQLNKKLLYLK
ncbi:MAG: T9SS type A sorting domain-containing protein, partial [Bacteroidales bacterium]|nr:T9SS type A sorting domain-containing protein [Bacteroidales bacterium]